MKAIIQPTEYHAKQFDYEHNSFTGNRTEFKYNRIPLKATTTLTKDEYAELLDIPQFIYDTNENEEVIGEAINPAYEELEDSYTLHQIALDVGNHFDVVDEEGNVTGYECPVCGEPVDVVELDDNDIYYAEE